MIKYNEDNKIERLVVEIEPITGEGGIEFNRSLLSEFNNMSPKDRAMVIEAGFEYLNYLQHKESDRVAGV